MSGGGHLHPARERAKQHAPAPPSSLAKPKARDQGRQASRSAVTVHVSSGSRRGHLQCEIVVLERRSQFSLLKCARKSFLMMGCMHVSQRPNRGRRENAKTQENGTFGESSIMSYELFGGQDTRNKSFPIPTSAHGIAARGSRR